MVSTLGQSTPAGAGRGILSAPSTPDAVLRLLTRVAAALGSQPGGTGSGTGGTQLGLPLPQVMGVLLGQIQEAAYGEAESSRGGHGRGGEGGEGQVRL